MTRWEGESNESIYEKYDFAGLCANGMKCSVVEWMKRNTLRWFGHMEGKKGEAFVKVYVSETDGPRRRGRSVVRWKDRLKEYMYESVADRGKGIELGRRECMDRVT